MAIYDYSGWKRKSTQTKRYNPYKKKYPTKKSSKKKAPVRTKTRSKSVLRRPTYIQSNAISHFQGFLNPFLNVKPKLLDTGSPPSLGLKIRNVNTFLVKAGKTAVVYYAPTCGGNCFVYADVDVSPTSTVGSFNLPEPAVETISDKIGYTAGTLEFPRLSYNPNRTVLPSGATNKTLTRSGDISQWRFVSGGVNVSCLEPNQKDGGFYESFFLNSRPGSLNDVLFIEESKAAYLTSNNDGSGGYGPSLDWLNNKILTTQKDITQHGYCSGLIKNMNKEIFTVKPIIDNHPYINIPEVSAVSFNNTNVTNGDPNYVDSPSTPVTPADSARGVLLNTSGGSGVDNLTKQNLTYDRYFDHSYNSFIIVIRPNANNQNFKIDTVANFEVVYSNESELSNFHEKPPSNVAAHKKAHDIKSAQAKTSVSIA